jgi:hypothetical protein
MGDGFVKEFCSYKMELHNCDWGDHKIVYFIFVFIYLCEGGYTVTVTQGPHTPPAHKEATPSSRTRRRTHLKDMSKIARWRRTASAVRRGAPRTYALRIIPRSTVTQLPDHRQPLPALAFAHSGTHTRLHTLPRAPCRAPLATSVIDHTRGAAAAATTHPLNKKGGAMTGPFGARTRPAARLTSPPPMHTHPGRTPLSHLAVGVSTAPNSRTQVPAGRTRPSPCPPRRRLDKAQPHSIRTSQGHKAGAMGASTRCTRVGHQKGTPPRVTHSNTFAAPIARGRPGHQYARPPTLSGSRARPGQLTQSHVVHHRVLLSHHRRSLPRNDGGARVQDHGVPVLHRNSYLRQRRLQ